VRLPVASAALSLLLALAGCGGAPSPEQEVRDTIAAGEQAAEDRDASELTDLISEHYSDAEGRDAEVLSQYLRGYLLTHPSIHLVTRIESIEFPYRDFAKVRVTVGSLAREDAGETLDLAADVDELEIELTKEGDDWRVTRASRAD
jgi:hypothetical protein